jgi:hypothetical protein
MEVEMLMNIQAFSGADLQAVRAVLEEAERSGISDISEIKKKIIEEIDKRIMELWNHESKPKRCPSCGKGFLQWRVDLDGQPYEICSGYKCGYSRVAE